jgi:hypothetical protein
MICEFALTYRGQLRRCGRVSGLRVWYDVLGTLHAACDTHTPLRLAEYPEAPAPDPDRLSSEVLRQAAELVTWTDAGYDDTRNSVGYDISPSGPVVGPPPSRTL